jgi:hypothetical protein
VLKAGNLCQLKRTVRHYDNVYAITKDSYEKLIKGTYLTVVKVLLSKRVAVQNDEGDLYTMSMSLLNYVTGRQPNWEV